MKNYQVTYNEKAKTTTVSFHHKNVIVHNTNSMVKDYLSELFKNYTSFKDIFRILQTNPTLTIETK